MAQRSLILLSPYRLPTQHSVTLSDEDMAAWLNGYSALWHPAALWETSAPPRTDSAYDHETPRAGHIYAVPDSPASLLPSDWEDRARAAGAFVFRATRDRDCTFANLKSALALGAPQEWCQLAEQTEASVAPFLGLGLGFLLLATLSDAMEHENLLNVNDFWADVQSALAKLRGGSTETPPSDSEVPPLQAAATRLMASREVLYPVMIHLLDLVLLEEQDIENPWPVTVTVGEPINVIASGSMLESLNRLNPEAFAALADALRHGQAEVCGGDYLEREEALLPVESQLWNLRKGLTRTQELLGAGVRVYARRRFGAHPHLPTWLNQHGISKAVFLPVGDGGLPNYNSPVINWSGPDGQSLECFVRKPLATDSVDTFFNLGHHLFKTTREDHIATLAFVHGKKLALPWYGDLLELSRLAPVVGQWTTFSRYFETANAGEHVGTLVADDFHFDYLSERVPGETPANTGSVLAAKAYPSIQPVSGFSQHLRLRRRLDTCWTLAALQRGLAGASDPQQTDKLLRELEDRIECHAAATVPAEVLLHLAQMETQIAGNLAERLVARAQNQQPGYLLLNPCSFTRRLALELDGRCPPIPVVDPVKAVQIAGDKLLVVAEVPPLGFAWFPQEGPAGAPPPSRMRLADDRCVRNEFFEAEIDLASGGLRAIRDRKTQLNRLSQRLIFRPGSAMKATKVETTSTGPALGEIVSEGVILGPQNQMLARFRQRFRAWLGRPILDLRIEIHPEQPPAGNPWHAYFAAQFAWRDERAMLLRGLGGMNHVTSHIRPQTPDFLEIRLHQQRTTIFPDGLPFHQREGGRMLDVLLVTPGEHCQEFDLAIGLDREQPMQTALGLATPATVVPTSKGPPHVGAKGWLFHLDASNLLLTSMRPGGQEINHEGAPTHEHMDAITARLLECGGVSTPAELRCVRDPKHVALLDARGLLLMDGTHNGDAALFHAGPAGLVQLLVRFSE